MKKSLLLFLFLSAMVLTSLDTQAQTEKGNIIFGTQIANLGATFQNHSNVFNFEVTPGLAIFTKNNFAIGGMIDLGYSAPKNSPNTFSYGIGPWARYYFDGPESIKFSQHASFFVDGFVGFQGESHSKGGGSTNGLGIKVGPGVSYFLTRNVSIDGSLNYNLVLGFGNSTTLNRIGVNVGFQIFLPSHSLKEKIRQGDL